MRQWFEKINWKLQCWMQGRYGQDELSRVLWIVSLVFLLLGGMVSSSLLLILAWAFLFYSVFRAFSKNIGRRQAERATYLALIQTVKSFFSLQKRRWADRKTFRYYRCKTCGQVLRVPKGKGKLLITCPKCGAAFEKMT